MIKITSLNKIYKSKKRKRCHALNDINLTLPDTGLVFVLGKSGSGKSTLLNLIGGLDNITSGSIEVDGNDLSKFKEKDFCNYRNSHIGFIFQDYHLIDELTVYENIKLSLDLEHRNEKHLVGEALARVDLAGYEDRYPSELSGGEQQRIAIARAIVKKPRLILADEPTGNLDTNTAKAIVELLKELSKECLILIVSHNVNDANNYADRIIELKKGQIISDKSRNPEFLDEVSLKNGELVYPDGLALSKKDICFINENQDKKLIMKEDKFLPTNEPNGKAKKIKIHNKNLSLGRELNLSGKFLKNKTVAIMLSSFMVAVIMVIMALAQTVINFDAGKIIADEMGKQQQYTLLLNKVLDANLQKRADGKYRVAFSEADIQAFYDAGYKGKIYPVYNVTVTIAEYKAFSGISVPTIGTNRGLMTETFGTIVVDEEFLQNKFGELNFCAKLKNPHPAGVYITDYVADSIIGSSPQNGTTYEELLGEHYKYGWTIPTNIINGIIETGYKERYSELLDKIKNKEFENSNALYEDEEFGKFTSEIYEKLGYSYSLNPDFEDEYKEWSEKKVLFRQNLVINDTFEMKNNTDFINYYVWGTKETAMLRDAWAYTVIPPEVPKNAKYMRVAFGVTGTIAPPNNGAPNLFLMDNARLVFSDGSTPSPEVLNFENGNWLGTEGKSIKGTHPKSQISDYIEIPNGATVKEFITYTHQNYAFCAFYDEDKNFISAKGYNNRDRSDLPEGSVMMTINDYNKIFGTEYTAETAKNFVPHEIKLTHYAYSDVNKEHPLFEKTVKIIGLHNAAWYLSSDVSSLFAKDQVYYNALYFDGTDGIGAALNTAKKLDFEPQSYAVEGIHTMTTAVDVFVPIFELVAIFLCIGVIFILMSFSSKMIKGKMHEIGIMKALGAKNSSIGVVFGLQVALIAILTCILASAGYFVFIDLANEVLVESMMRFNPSGVVLDLKFLTFQPKIAVENCILVGILALISLVLPMIRIKAIKPVKIIKAKD